MTQALSTRTLKYFSSTTHTVAPRPKLVADPPPPRTPPQDSFETTKDAAPRRDGDAFDAPVKGAPGDDVVALAQSVLGEDAHDLKLANDTPLGDAMQDGVPDDVNCANFVSGLLVATGQIPKSERNAGVVNLVANLKKDENFTRVSLDDASPGDVVAFEYTRKNGTKGHHVVVFEGRDADGQPRFIGSDNVNPDGTQQIHESTGVRKGRRVLAVMHYQGPAPEERR